MLDVREGTFLCRLIFAILLGLASFSALAEGKHWKIDRVNCSTDVCTHFDCTIERKSPRLQVLNGFCTLADPISSMMVRSRLLYRTQATYRTFLYDMRTDLCDHLGPKRKFQPLLAAAAKHIRRYSNIHHPCPYVGNVTVHNLPYHNGMMENTIIPDGHYRIDMHIYEAVTNRTIFLALVYVTV